MSATQKNDKRLLTIDEQLNALSSSMRPPIEKQNVVEGIGRALRTADQDDLIEINQRLHGLEKNTEQLQERVEAVADQQESLVQRMQENLPEYVKVNDWLTRLSAEKRDIVQEIYVEQQEKMMKTVPVSPDVMPPTAQEMHALVQENRRELNSKLKEILTAEEYRNFQESLNASPFIPALPPISNRR